MRIKRPVLAEFLCLHTAPLIVNQRPGDMGASALRQRVGTMAFNAAEAALQQGLAGPDRLDLEHLSQGTFTSAGTTLRRGRGRAASEDYL